MALPPKLDTSAATKAQLHQNQPYDESLEVPDADDVPSTYTPTPRSHNPLGRISNPGIDQSGSPHLLATSTEDAKKLLGKSLGRSSNLSDDDDDGSDLSDDDDDDEEVHIEGAYDPADYDNLQVSPDIKDLFEYISRYSYQVIELEHKLKPFIPDFIPSVGDTDAFIKIPRPDMKPDMVGLTVLDEPCAAQSDPTVLDLQLRTISKQTTAKQMVVKSLEQAEKDPKQIDNWIQNIDKLHRSKPPPNVHYTKNMPQIDSLMQEWPSELEELLKEVSLPSASMDTSLADYIRAICCILDIPVYQTSHNNDMIQALHVLFTLYNEFQNSQHFQTLAQEYKMKKEANPNEQLVLDGDNEAPNGN
ncbi:transport 46 homolog isoform X2 [Octopus vulgaris]|uniref:Intraflagellar transport protein 46 homolog n=1 Tax=Octopus vulgaris TaxID=6645 RepID=A0AA36B6V6_OCTVU|nr:transport 46 homolog isoform X2 [Octopus vulgaris]